MTRVLYSCPFVPAEWIAAHGLSPGRILPNAEGALTAAEAGRCPYAAAWARTVRLEPHAAAVFTTTCDQMRRTGEQLAREGPAPVFLMNVPATWQTRLAHTLYRDELSRLGRFLCRHGGHAPTPFALAAAMRQYAAGRATLRAARTWMGARDHAEALTSFHRDGCLDLRAPARSAAHGLPLALVGGPLMPHHFDLFDLIERAGGDVVLDGTTGGERTMPAPFDTRLVESDPLGALVDAYFGAIPDAFRRPNTALYRWLQEQIAARSVRGIVFLYHVWCDTWHAEAQRMRQWAPVPLTAIAAPAGPGIDGHTVSRIEAFLEMLR